MAADVIQRVLSEDLLSFKDALKDIRQQQAGSNLHIATIHRWAQRGCCGVKLEAVRVGGRWVTSRQAVHRFLRALNGV